MVERILVALADSKNRQHTFETALSLAQASDARLMIMHVLTPEDELVPAYCESFHSGSPQIDQGLQDNVAQNLDDLRSLYTAAKSMGIMADLAQTIGDPGQRICEQARYWGADLILLEKPGDSEPDKPLAEAVSNYVMHHAPCKTQIIL